MAIALECDVCGKKYKLSDTLAGKTFTCKECGLALDVPGGRRTFGEEVIDRKPPKSSATMRTTGGGGKRHVSKKSQNNPMPMLAVGGGVLVVVVILGAIFGGGGNQNLSLAPPTPAPDVTPPPVATGTPAPVTTPGTTTPTPAVSTPTSTANVKPGTPATSTTTTPGTTPPAVAATPTAIAGASKAIYDLEVSGWSATVDPPAEPLPTEWATDWKLPVTGRYLSDEAVSYPANYSPFVILGTNEDAKSARDVWNLATGKKVNTFKGQRLSSSNPVALSPDGQLLAWYDYKSITIYDFAAKKPLGELPAGFGNAKVNIGRLDLPTKNRVVAQSAVDRCFLAWSLPDGQPLHSTPLGDKFAYPAKSAYSPGGKYIALEIQFLEHNIQIHEVDTGKVVGTITAKKINNSVGDLHPLAFSPDGRLLAAAYESSSGDGITQIALWNMADGTRVAQHLITPAITQRVKNVRETAGLQWFADGQKLLVHGVAIVDVKSGDVLYELDKPEPSFASSRKALGTNTVVDLTGTRQELELKPLVISESDLHRSAQVAAAGGLAVDVKLPPLTKAELNVPTTSVAASDWRAAPIGPPTGPEVTGEPLALKTGKGVLRQLHIALQDQPRAFFKMSDGEDANASRYPDVTFRVDSQGRLQSRSRPKAIKAKTNWVDVYDLAAKQFLSKIDLPFSADLVSCSPDGRRILVQPHDAQGRLDVFDVADGQPVVAFRPYQSLPDEKHWTLAAAVMLDAEHVATLNDDDLFVVWELPACRARYAVSKALSFIVSPGGQYVAIATETGVDLRESASGTAVGFIPFQGSIRSLAFHPQGDRLAVMLNDQGGTYVFTVDLKDGRIGDEIPCPVNGAIAWVSDRYLLVDVEGEDIRLLDLDAKTVAWNYPLRNGVTASNIPDARLWYAIAKSPRVAALQLVAVTLPDEAVAKKLEVMKPSPDLLLQPGEKVAVRIRVTPPPTRPQMENEVIALIHKAVERSGVSIAASAPVELQVTAEGKPGQNITLQKLGTQENVSIQELKLEMQLTYKRGPETLWQDKLTASNASGYIMKRIGDGESVQAAFDKDLWDRMTRYCNGLQLPAYLFANKSVVGLGSSTLGPTGPVTGTGR
ncbi:MAG TPA: WD40 repeat domain-containing protein [Planctomycetaceae bacterium]|nr:WD40 repeat domain-containing protein [Planctomycetaceae bacterium]